MLCLCSRSRRRRIIHFHGTARATGVKAGGGERFGGYDRYRSYRTTVTQLTSCRKALPNECGGRGCGHRPTAGALYVVRDNSRWQSTSWIYVATLNRQRTRQESLTPHIHLRL